MHWSSLLSIVKERFWELSQPPCSTLSNSSIDCTFIRNLRPRERSGHLWPSIKEKAFADVSRNFKDRWHLKSLFAVDGFAMYSLDNPQGKPRCRLLLVAGANSNGKQQRRRQHLLVEMTNNIHHYHDGGEAKVGMVFIMRTNNIGMLSWSLVVDPWSLMWTRILPWGVHSYSSGTVTRWLPIV